MKNWEKYEKEIKEFGLGFAVLKDSNEVVDCTVLFNCEGCLFYEDNYSCEKERIRWLYADYKEPVVLTDDERKLCELLGRGCLTRDKDGTLFHYVDDKPKKNRGSGMWCSGTNFISINRAFPQCKFDFVKWNDEEPWSIKELIKGV